MSAGIFWIGNTNLEPMKARAAGHRVGPFGQAAQLLLDPRSELYDASAERVFLFLDGEELLKDIYYRIPGPEALTAATGALTTILDAVETFLRARPQARLAISTFVLPPGGVFTYLDANADKGASALERALNETLARARVRIPGLLLLDWSRLVRLHGYHALYSDTFAYLGRIKLTDLGFEQLALEARRLFDADRSGGRKVLALDADNVLWGGVLGEAGAEGIELSEEGIGRAYRDFQRQLKALKDAGVLLALVSKNNPADIERVWSHPMMVLGPKDFAAKRVNWQDKAANLAEIIDELGLAADAFVFIDDLPAERQRVRTALPGVAVPEMPADAALLKRWFAESVAYEHFARTRLTDEDRSRTRLYQQRSEREKTQKLMSVEDFLRTLNIQADARTARPDDAARAAQLTQRTHQFTLTGRVFDEAAFRAMAGSARQIAAVLDYRDTFGSEGTVGVAVAELAGDAATLEAFALSCRVIGRGVEARLLAFIEAECRRRGARTLKVRYVPGERNQVCAGFLKAFGYADRGAGVHERGL